MYNILKLYWQVLTSSILSDCIYSKRTKKQTKPFQIKMNHRIFLHKKVKAGNGFESHKYAFRYLILEL